MKQWQKDKIKFICQQCLCGYTCREGIETCQTLRDLLNDYKQELKKFGDKIPIVSENHHEMKVELYKDYGIE